MALPPAALADTGNAASESTARVRLQNDFMGFSDPSTSFVEEGGRKGFLWKRCL
jgi:hypothetical protein